MGYPTQGIPHPTGSAFRHAPTTYGAFKEAPNRPEKYAKSPTRPTCSGLEASHHAAQDATTSLASRSEPSWNLTPWRKVKVQTVASALGEYASASEGMTMTPPTS